MVKRDGESQIATTVQAKQGASQGLLEGVFVVSVREGADSGIATSLSASQPARLLIGQSSVCDLVLSDPLVSRRHASLEVVAGAIRVRDLGSTNGTFIDRVRIADAFLEGGETVRVGATILAIDFESEVAAPIPPNDRFGKVLGASPQMRRLYPLCAKLAGATVPVIIEGETGTGKEALAESLHELGPRAQGPFIVFDCTTAPPNLVESELFGHERGSFTGAVATRKGVFEQAHGGTLFIDEIGDLDLPLQAKLLRAIERSEVRRVGGDRWIKVDVRILSATRRDLDREVAAGRFRDDLFHRLAVTRVELPPLRQRQGDVAQIARALWASMGGGQTNVPSHILARWEDDAWPGNVRELRNAVMRQLAIGELTLEEQEGGAAADSATAAPAGASGAPDVIGAVIEARLGFATARDRVLAEFERRYVGRVFDAHGGDIAKAAAASGIGRRYFQMIRARVR